MLHTHKVAGSNPAGNKFLFGFVSYWSGKTPGTDTIGFPGVMVSTLDFESSDPSSNLGETLSCEDHFFYYTTAKIHVI